MAKFVDITGQRFDYLTAVRNIRSGHYSKWECLCDCGGTGMFTAAKLRSRAHLTCGCDAARRRQNAETSKRMTTHGRSKSPAHSSWASMIQRCFNPNNQSHADYGGRGISVCPEWRDFAVFLADMGERPHGMTLDRIDVNGNYEPGNCRWATWSQQGRNRRNVKLDATAVEQVGWLIVDGGFTRDEVARAFDVSGAAVELASGQFAIAVLSGRGAQ